MRVSSVNLMEVPVFFDMLVTESSQISHWVNLNDAQDFPLMSK